jgi:hypothetical protein
MSASVKGNHARSSGQKMSEQSDALNKKVRDKGIDVGGPNPPLPGMEGDAGRPDLPKVQLPRGGGRSINSFARELGAIVGANGLFRRDTVPVTINPEDGRLEDMTSQRFRTYVQSQALLFEQTFQKKTGVIELEENMFADEASACLACDAFRYPLRKLRRVNFVRLPTMRANGALELLPKGYDAASEILTMKSGLEYPTDWELERCIRFFEKFHEEVPFENLRSRSCHICAHVAMFGSALLPKGADRLNFCYRANKPRSGKGLFLQSAIVGPFGPFVEVKAIPESREEFHKMIDTEVLNGSAYMFLDEVESHLKNKTLNALITSTRWSGRLFHSQKKFVADHEIIAFIAGNNITLSGDLTGRFLLVDFYVAEADPQKRPIKHVIDKAYLSRDEVRADLLAATWGLFEAWDKGIGAEQIRDKAGKLLEVKIIKTDKRAEPSSVFRGFETFSQLFGGIVQNAGYANPMESVAEHIDPDYADMMAIVERLADGVEKRAEYEFHQLIDVCRELNLFEWHLEGKMVKSKSTEVERDGAGKVVGGGTTEVERFELTPKSKSWFGKLFTDSYGGTVFSLADGRRVQFGRRGKNRQRRYTIEIVTAAGALS